MAYKRRNIFYGNKKQEATEIEHVSALVRHLRNVFRRFDAIFSLSDSELYCDYPQSLKLKTASKHRNTFYDGNRNLFPCPVPPGVEMVVPEIVCLVQGYSALSIRQIAPQLESTPPESSIPSKKKEKMFFAALRRKRYLIYCN
ncbi:hypothetical protein AAG570_004124 [Ranatra chinensis]|uniref:Uncharacterized protein n=1 Tax=Ranatra chinensis TaxID=642074 RepID=A0ABD0YPP4_9HEMI